MGLTNSTEGAMGKPTTTLRAKEVVVLALCFGVATGLVEGGLLLTLQHFRWLAWSVQEWSVSSDIVWISSALDVLLFLAVAFLGLVLGRWLPHFDLLRWSVFLFVWIACFDWLALSGRIRAYGALVLAAGLASVAMRWFSLHEASAMRFARRSLPWVLAAAVLALVGIHGGFCLTERIATARLPAIPSVSPNILVIVVDTLRADHLSAYGYARATSPNFDRIAKQGVLFENAYAASSWTLPSHASLLTGRHLYEHADSREYYDGRFPNIAEALRSDGYRTGAFSANTFFFCRGFGFGRGFLHFEDYFSSLADTVMRTFYGRKFVTSVLFPLGYNDIPGRKRAQEVNREFFRWVDRAPGKPFFAFLNYYDVHDPYRPPQPYRSRFASLNNPGGLINQMASHLPNLTPEQLQGERDAYDGAIAYADLEIGKLFSDLQARGLSRNTLVVITSDHGEEFHDHDGLLFHGRSLFREEIHVPLIFWWPGRIPTGVRLETPVSNAFLPATIMDLLAQPQETMFPGPSLAQLWKNSATVSELPDPIAELARMIYDPENKLPIGNDGMKSLITSRWQYIMNDRLGEELYDWKEDPQELHNLAATPDGQRIDRELLARLRARVGESFGKHEVSEQFQAEEPDRTGHARTPVPQPLR
jgi:arylsulfatase A-like enzyme